MNQAADALLSVETIGVDTKPMMDDVPVLMAEKVDHSSIDKKRFENKKNGLFLI